MTAGADQIPTGRREADRILRAALADMETAGVPDEIAIDRLLTFGAFASVQKIGKEGTAQQLASVADLVGKGLFDA